MGLRSDKPRVQAARYGCVGGPFDDGAAIREECELVGFAPELEDELVMLHAPVGRESLADLCKAQHITTLVDLDGISAAKGYLWSCVAAQVQKITLSTSPAVGSRRASCYFCLLILPDVK